ncbi:ABC-type transport auxiliary lipoprotein family protein [Sphingomonas flavalba]|uniref:ABC-type transport auxiliary lipoprotein family protein n=1 Tax=Sphingomonas flavalba TaxID=2559804 RepID=UPI0039DFB8F5
MKPSLPALLLLSLPLAGCISLGSEPPKELLTLTASASPEAGRTLTAKSGETITILTPALPQALATGRIPVQSGATAIAFVKDAQWVEAPNRLFQRLLSDTIEARSGRSVLSPRQFALDPGIRVSGELSRFDVDEGSRTVIVRYEASIARDDSVETRRFEARAPVAAIEARSVSAALNQAANQVAAEASDWITGATPAQ